MCGFSLLLGCSQAPLGGVKMTTRGRVGLVFVGLVFVRSGRGVQNRASSFELQHRLKQKSVANCPKYSMKYPARVHIPDNSSSNNNCSSPYTAEIGSTRASGSPQPLHSSAWRFRDVQTPTALNLPPCQRRPAPATRAHSREPSAGPASTGKTTQDLACRSC